MTITVGTGGQAFGAVFSGVPASPGPPYYIYNAPSGDDGLGGYPGTSSMLYSPTLGTILRCDGGSGSAFNGVDSFGGSKVAGNLNGALTGSGSPSFSTPNRIATGPFATVDGPGACGASLYGVGNRGRWNHSNN